MELYFESNGGIMNKSLITLLFLCAVGSLSADLKQDLKTARYYSIPATGDINQSEYHQLVWVCKDILNKYAQQHAQLLAQYPGASRSGAYDPENWAGKNAVTQHLQRIATSTSMRLLSDLEKINFCI